MKRVQLMNERHSVVRQTSEGALLTGASRGLEAVPERWDPERSLQWLRSNLILVTGLVLIVAQLWWKAGLLERSYFRLDDYYYVERASAIGLNWNYLLWVNAGHLNVVGAAIAWLIVRISPYDWALASAVTLLLLGGTCFALLRMLRTLFGDRPGILLLLTLYMLSPLSLIGLSWWTVALGQLPLQLAICCAVTAHVSYLRTRRYRHAIASAAWMAVAMLTDFRATATLLLLFAVTAAFFTQGSWPRALWPALREHWRAWALYVALDGAYLSLYAIRLRTSAVTPSSPTAGDALTYAGMLLRKTFLPGAFGGPWDWSSSGIAALVNPPSVLIGVSEALALVVVLVSLMYTWRAWRAWAILAGWLAVVDIAPVAAGRSSFGLLLIAGLATRYVWDATAILALCLGLAFMPLAGVAGPGRSRRRLSRPEYAATTTLVAAIVVGSLWSFHDYQADPTAASASSYIDTARQALADAPSGTVIVDGPVPADVIGPGYISPITIDGSLRQVTYASSVLAPLEAEEPAASRLQFISQPYGTYDHLLAFNGFGQLVTDGIIGTGSPARPGGASCWPSTDGVVVVPLSPAATGASELRIGYLAAGPGKVLVTFGTRSLTYNVQEGLNSAFFPVSGSAGSVIIQQVSGTMPCIGDVEVGALFPSAAGPGIPASAVTG